MDEAGITNTFRLGDQATSDVIIHLRDKNGRLELFYCHSSILSRQSKFFANKISECRSTSPPSHHCIRVFCSETEYDHHVKLLRLLYMSAEAVLDSWDSVKSALGVLQAAIALCCEDIVQSCIKYLEAAPWAEKEEKVILKTLPRLGAVAMPILTRVEPVDLDAAKNVLISAIRFATSTHSSGPPFTDELKTSAQEQVEYMLVDDEDVPFITADDDVKSELKKGLSKLFALFIKRVTSLLSEFDGSLDAAENKVLRSLSDIEWICNILTKFEMMKDFVCKWLEISVNILTVVQDRKFSCNIWAVKAKLIELTGKAFDAVGYGNVILPASSRVQLLKIWLPYIRIMKPLLDSKCAEDAAFLYMLDANLCQGIEGAIVSLVLALPSNDQADILADWMQTEQVRYPDLSEAFVVWCYRTKAAKRRLQAGLDEVGNAAVSL